MMVSQAAVHLQAPVVAEQARPVTMSVQQSPHQSSTRTSSAEKYRGDSSDNECGLGSSSFDVTTGVGGGSTGIADIKIHHGLGVDAGGVDASCNSVWAHGQCTSGSGCYSASSCRVPPLPILANVTNVVAGNHTGDECLAYQHSQNRHQHHHAMPPMSSHGASNDQTETSQTWDADILTGHVLPQMDIDLDSLPVGLAPPPPPSQSYTRCPGFWKCIVRLHRRFGQRIARQQIDRGLRLYRELRHEDAVRKWRSALRRINKQSDKFTILGYLCQAHAEWGGYREMIDFAFQQLDIAHEIDSHTMRAQAYLNLSTGNGAMSQFSKSITYCEHALEHLAEGNQDDVRTLCRLYIDLTKSYIGLSNFQKAAEYLDLALKLSRQLHDVVLEMNCTILFGHIFNMLKDFESGFQFHSKAHQMAKSIGGSTTADAQSSTKIVRQTEVNLIQPLRKQGRITDAASFCQDAINSAINDGDKPAQAMCLFCYGDIFRNKNDLEKALGHYEAAMRLMTSLDDVMGQCRVLQGIAKTFTMMKKIRKICDCRALQAHTLALQYATRIGNKLVMHHCHASMEEIYKNLGDEESQRREGGLAKALLSEMNLICGVCHKEYGVRPLKLQILPCSHIFHARCIRELFKKQCANPSSTSTIAAKKRICPECRKTVMSKTTWMSTSSDDTTSVATAITSTVDNITGIPV